MIIRYPISNLNSQNLGSGPRKYIQTQDSGQKKIWSHDHTLSNLNSQNLGSGPRKYIQTQDSGQTKIWSHDHTVSNLKSQFPKIRVRTQKVYLSKPKHDLWKRKNIQSQISILKTKGQDLGSIFHHNTQCKRKILSPNNIVFNLKS